MKTLIAVTTCHARRAQADAQRQTWASPDNWKYLGRPETDVKFFLGREAGLECGVIDEVGDSVYLDCGDGYASLPAKVKGVMAYALERGYDSVLKVDDDVYLIPRRVPDYSQYINQFGTYGCDYVGNFRMHNGHGYPYDYASGFCYWLGRRAMEEIAAAPFTEDTMEDRWVGQHLAISRSMNFDEKRFCCPYPNGVEEAKFLWGSPIGKTHIAFAQYPAEKLHDMNHWFFVAFVNNRSEHGFV